MPIYTSKELTQKSFQQLRDFQTGKTPPLTTGRDYRDEVLMGGYLPSTIHSLAGISGAGKSHELQVIENHLLDHYDDVVIGRNNWEMSHLKLLIRSLQQKTGKSTKEIIFQEPDEATMKQYLKVLERESTPRLIYSPDPLDAGTFFEEMKRVIDKYQDKKLVLTVDHLGLVVDDEGSQKRSADKLVANINRLNKMHPYLVWIVLIQMNRDIEHRTDPKHHAPRRSDLYATDTLFHLSDLVEVVHNPWRLGIERYMVFGQHRYEWLDEFKRETESETTNFETEGVLFHHYIKTRMMDMTPDFRDLYAERIYTPKPPPETKKSEKKEEKDDDGFDF